MRTAASESPKGRARHRQPPRRRPATSWVAPAASALAGLLVFLAMVAPREIGQLTPGAFVRIPIEGIVGVALLLLLPPRPRRVVAAVGGAVLGLLVIVKLLDMGFLSVLARPFDPVLDWVLLDNAREFLTGSIGPAGAIGAAIGAVVLAVAVVVLLALSTLRLSRVVDRHRTTATKAVALLTVAWLVCAGLGAQLVAPVPVAARSIAALAYEKAVLVPTSLHDERTFTELSAVDAFRDTPAEQLLTGLRGKDVVLTFVESYGRSAVEDPRYAPQVDAVLDSGTARLAEAGFTARSGWLTSPTFGGGSWLAHSTLHSGLKIDNQDRYRNLVASDRLTLGSAFREAGWETANVMPGTNRAWPEGQFFGVDRVHDATTLGYRGPGFSWSPMPDQYALSAFEHLERGRPDRGPLMGQVELTSSHVPWTPVPRLVDWDAVGDGTVFGPQVRGVDPPDVVEKDGDRVRTTYRKSIEYSLNTLVSYVQRYGDDRLVLVFLGDHQPSPIASGAGASHDVPISIVTRDRSVLERITDWQWADGLRPRDTTPVWPMEAFRDKFLIAFGPGPADGARH